MSGILLDHDGPVMCLTLNRTDASNLLDAAVIGEILKALGEIDRNKAFRAILLTGSRDCFCAGLASNVADGPAHIRALLSGIRASPVPVVVAVNGDVTAEGILLAMSGDWILADEAVRFAQLSRAIRAARETGLAESLPPRLRDVAVASPESLDATVPASQVAAWGLVNECLAAGQLQPTALAVAKRLAEGPTGALVATRRLVDEAPGASFAEQYRRELEVNYRLRASDDAREGVKAFLEKRPARFRGR